MTPHLAAISLMIPAMLGGLALLSLPVLAHLLNRRARRTVVFPNVSMLVASSASHSSLFKLRRWILLLLRCLAVILLVGTGLIFAVVHKIFQVGPDPRL